jgi:hypothetical protein
MGGARDIWLVRNEASGSNDAQALAALEACCGKSGLRIRRQICFPGEPLPGPGDLDAAGIDSIAVFTGDGTANSLIAGLAGWRGAVLVLPGGTMNLLYHRLHGDRDMVEVVALASAGKTRRRRPGVIRCAQGTAMVDLLAGPGTRWYEVREAMREADVLAVADSTAQAIEETLADPGIACRGVGRREGYPLVMLTTHDAGIEVSGFYAETPGEFLAQGWALLRRNFREGPHDNLGLWPRVTLESTDGQPFGLLLDGEKAEAAGAQEFVLAPCEVDLLATEADD